MEVEIIDKDAVYNQDGRGWLVRSSFHTFIVVHSPSREATSYDFFDRGPAIGRTVTIPASTYAYLAEPLDDGARWTEVNGRPVAGGPGLTHEQVVALIPTHHVFWCDECGNPTSRLRPVRDGIWWCDSCVEKVSR